MSGTFQTAYTTTDSIQPPERSCKCTNRKKNARSKTVQVRYPRQEGLLQQIYGGKRCVFSLPWEVVMLVQDRKSLWQIIPYCWSSIAERASAYFSSNVWHF